MASRRDFLQQGLGLTAASFLSVPLIGCASGTPVRHSSTAAAAKAPSHAPLLAQAGPPAAEM
ncbi:hypothetical protein E4L98_26580, partial [Duganella callida]